MLTEEQLQQFDNFCTRFKKTDIDGYNDGGYENGLGNTDPDLDFSDWNETEELREEFNVWIKELFPGKKVECGFSTQRLEVYEKVYDNLKESKKRISEALASVLKEIKERTSYAQDFFNKIGEDEDAK